MELTIFDQKRSSRCGIFKDLGVASMGLKNNFFVHY